MKNSRVSLWIRLTLIICGAALIYVLYLPMWRIDLNAPQYPEGLKLLIYPHQLGGDVDIINGLNHYIGMKTLHTGDFIEFSILPYSIISFALAFVLTGILGRRKLLYLLFILFVAFGILAMYDFWRWEYNYGHNLNPGAAIIVPGMSYQPPLIGFKQLLNFGAYSMPDMGGWIFVGVGGVLLTLVLITWFRYRKWLWNSKGTSIISVLFLITMASCNAGPDPIKMGKDNCTFCKMTVSDARFGAEIVTGKGKNFKFDDMHCLLSYLRSGQLSSAEIKDIYFTDFCDGHRLLNVKNCFFLKSDAFKSPMEGNTAAFSNNDSLKRTAERFIGSMVRWDELNK